MEAYNKWRKMIGGHILPPYDKTLRDSSDRFASGPFLLGEFGSPDFERTGLETLKLLWQRTLFKDEQDLLDGRKIALTGKGTLGLVSSRAVEGDIVCQLTGSFVPFVLHPTEVTGSPELQHNIQEHFGDRISDVGHFKFCWRMFF